eukprot:Sdes_comp19868_c0_seq1m12141
MGSLSEDGIDMLYLHPQDTILMPVQCSPLSWIQSLIKIGKTYEYKSHWWLDSLIQRQAPFKYNIKSKQHPCIDEHETIAPLLGIGFPGNLHTKINCRKKYHGDVDRN